MLKTLTTCTHDNMDDCNLNPVFVGVHFANENKVAIVNKLWLTPLKCETFWPPYKNDAQYSRALQGSELPKEGMWKIYPITKCYFECDNLKKQRTKYINCNIPQIFRVRAMMDKKIFCQENILGSLV